MTKIQTTILIAYKISIGTNEWRLDKAKNIRR